MFSFRRFLLVLIACSLVIPLTLSAAGVSKKIVDKANKRKATPFETKAAEYEKLSETASAGNQPNLAAAYKEYAKALRKMVESFTPKKAGEPALDADAIETEIKTAAMKCLCFGGKVDYRLNSYESSNLSKYKDAAMLAALAAEKNETELVPLLDKQVVIYYKRIITDNHETDKIKKLKEEETQLTKEMIPGQKKIITLRGQLIKLTSAEKNKLSETAYNRATIPTDEITTAEPESKKEGEKTDKKPEK